jgi:hypothetical protein
MLSSFHILTALILSVPFFWMYVPKYKHFWVGKIRAFFNVTINSKKLMMFDEV